VNLLRVNSQFGQLLIKRLLLVALVAHSNKTWGVFILGKVDNAVVVCIRFFRDEIVPVFANDLVDRPVIASTAPGTIMHRVAAAAHEGAGLLAHGAELRMHQTGLHGYEISLEYCGLTKMQWRKLSVEGVQLKQGEFRGVENKANPN
jgi:hypothetical protein